MTFSIKDGKKLIKFWEVNVWLKIKFHRQPEHKLENVKSRWT